MRRLPLVGRYFFMAGFVILLQFALIAQETFNPAKPGGVNKAERVEALRVAFISERLNLTPKEAQHFWPVYNQYRSDLENIHRSFKPAQDVSLTADQQIEMEQKKLDLKKRYKPQFENALGKGKMNQLYNIEGEFHQKLKDMRDQRQNQNRNRPQGPPPNGPRPGGPQPGGSFRPGSR